MKYLLGYDIGSSSIKAALLEADSGAVSGQAFSPSTEMQIISTRSGFAEQDPETWWLELVHATNKLRQTNPFKSDEIIGIGISYQMHGLVCIDKDYKSLRPAIIWCDSRAAEFGRKAFQDLGESYCLQHFLNSPGNFTASKLKWVKENEPKIYERIHKILLPGDFIALKLTGRAATTISGLSEGIFWDYTEHAIARSLLDYYGIGKELLADIVPSFGEQGRLSKEAGSVLGLSSGIPISYRAGDQPNNAWSLNVLEPGEIATTAGTSGVIYAVTDRPVHDPQSRVNAFVHVNHQENKPRYGVLLCINGTGILNSWAQKHFFSGLSYPEMNALAAKAPIGSDGLQFFPFGNGGERILLDKEIGGSLRGLEFNRHSEQHIARAAQEGIVFALNYGWEIMRDMGMILTTVRAGRANMFLSDIFASSFSNLTGCPLEFYNTDGSLGAARGAGLGAGYYANAGESFRGMHRLGRIEPNLHDQKILTEAYMRWKEKLKFIIQ
ncbi:MAG: xylulokinase [Chitinophagales bacterium]